MFFLTSIFLKTNVNCAMLNLYFVVVDGHESLAHVYPRLFSNLNQKDELIANVGKWVGDVWEWKFSWRMEWFVWERPLFFEFFTRISNKRFSKVGCDRWV